MPQFTAVTDHPTILRYCPGCGTQLVPDEKLVKPAAPQTDQEQR